VKELALPTPFILLPEFESAGRHFGIRLIGPVGATHDAGLAAGGGARIPGPPSINQRDTRAALEKVKGGPSAEGSGTDHGNVRFAFHGFKVSEFQGFKDWAGRE
jgi:hypothetical protein